MDCVADPIQSLDVCRGERRKTPLLGNFLNTLGLLDHLLLEPLTILHPLEIAYRHAVGVDQNVGEYYHAR